MAMVPDVLEGSIRAFLAAPVFVVHGGMVRRRSLRPMGGL